MEKVVEGSDDDLYISLSLQLSSFFYGLRLFLKSKIGSHGVKVLSGFFSLIYMFCFGLSFGLFRVVLKLYLPVKVQMIVLMLLYPGYANKVAFLIPFGLTIMNGLSKEINVKRFDILNMAYVQCIRFEYNVLSHVLYPLMKWLYMPLMPLLFLSFFWKTPIKIWLNFLKIFNRWLNTNFFQRFNLVGAFPLIILIVLLGMRYLSRFKGTIYLYLATILLITYYPFATTTFVDVGQGDSILIQMPFRSYTILVDTGRKSAYFDVKQTLRKNGVKSIDTLIITHEDLDHSENKDSLLSDYGGIIIDTKGQKVPFMYEYLQDKMYDNPNDNSLIFMSANGVFLSGDASRQQELDLLNTSVSICPTVLKLGHHGSKTSSHPKFLQDLNPKIVIASSKPSVYGHPHAEVLRDLYNLGIPVLQTSIHGSITLTHLGFVDIANTSKYFFGIINPVITCLK